MSRRVLMKDLKPGTYYLSLATKDKTAEVILTGAGGQNGYYFVQGIAKDYELANLPESQVFVEIPIPEGYEIL